METLDLKTIDKIGKESHYFVPSYQRGYRWDRQQVENLLNDLYEFMNEENNEIQDGQFYCLQPIVVRKRKEHEFEVIDGQQRLTTISILLQCLGESTFTVSYETRPKSQRILSAIQEYAMEEPQDVDHYYFKEACMTIQAWLMNFQPQDEEVVSRFRDILMQHTKVIWYEVPETTDVHELFMRLNVGKIPLTNAELIKASLLQPLKENARQELALQWEEMEQTLQDDAFWYFIEPTQFYTNRIELLFDMIVGKTSDQIDPFYTFYQMPKHHHFWKETRVLYARLQEWYAHRETYHLIGYLLHAKNSKHMLPELIALYNQDTIDSKETFISKLRQYVRKTLPNDLDGMYEYRYGTHNPEIQDALLLFNILEEMRSVRDTHRFPFDHYAKEHWSLEHIHAQKTEELKNRKQWSQWLKDASKLLSPSEHRELIESIQTTLQSDFDRIAFEEMVKEIEIVLKEKYSKLFIEGEDLHGLGNLALLDRRVNSTLGNHYYPIKFEALKQHERAGGYVPPATRKVFWKYYSNQPEHFEYWSSKDQEEYVKVIVDTFKHYFEEDTHAYV
ncbi:DUF262 domain-containing protein [Exiguobacterium sp. B2(2022)]|uniref:DUF262 domain-containing protein n=1 Tax=Exiguobacterium sp. B2(2022) TaxID=2992755 RepID=UPI00237A9331|nr:DUF262 domain-containing protein [Exiguobacterium sp. B2(2022)]MDE0564239.1 DUF262 domain-containing protein [Exiguobacterium sp. B2(2022)]